MRASRGFWAPRGLAAVLVGLLLAARFASGEDAPVSQGFSDRTRDAHLSANELSLQSGAVVVTCTWGNPESGPAGVGTPIPQTGELGQFSFASPGRVEVFVKVLDLGTDRPYALFWGGLTDLEYTVTFRQTQTGQTVTFRKEAGSACGGVNTTSLNHGPEPQPGGEITVMLPGGVPLVMVRIPAGAFLMGAPAGERGRREWEGPQHQVTLTSDYYIGKYEVTQAQWRAVMGSNPSPLDSCGDGCPMVRVSWLDIRGAYGFLERLDAHLSSTGQPGAGKYRLPTEAEWERAARGGTQTRFSFGDALVGDDGCGANAQADPYVWWCANSEGEAHEVASKLPNPYGLHGMHGNVWEWCEDWYGPYESSEQRDPTGPTIGAYRVYRGGSWSAESRDCRSASRFYYGAPGRRYGTLGFRLARSL